MIHNVAGPARIFGPRVSYHNAPIPDPGGAETAFHEAAGSDPDAPEGYYNGTSREARVKARLVGVGAAAGAT
ncbi:hypothetical protein ACFL0I_05145, partial [Gemmatimonadota bacterium]